MADMYHNLSDPNTTDVYPPDDDFEGPGNLEEVRQLVGYVLFSLIFALGTVSNSGVIYIILCCPGMRTPCNYLLMNIAIADLSVAFLSSPLRIVEIFTYRGWVLGETLCYVLAPVQDLFVSVSAVTYVALTVERYRVIVTPFKPKMTLKCIVMVCGFIWLGCYLAASLPLAVCLKHETALDGDGFECFPDWPSILYEKILKVHLLFWFIVVPVIIQIWAYYRILKSLGASSEITQSSQGNDARAKKKLQLVRTLVMTAVIFQVCLIPRGVLMVLMGFGQVSMSNTLDYAMLLVMVLYYIKHVTNPIILFTRSSEFRNQLKALFQSH